MKGLIYFLSSEVPSFYSKYLCDGGLLLISRYPIIENDFIPYYLNISGDSVSKKGALYAKIQIGKNFLFLFNTHLQASYYEDNYETFNYTVQTRTYQTEELINFVYNKILKTPRNEIINGKIILLGDFNIDAHDHFFAKKIYNIPKYKISEYEVL